MQSQAAHEHIAELVKRHHQREANCGRQRQALQSQVCPALLPRPTPLQHPWHFSDAIQYQGCADDVVMDTLQLPVCQSAVSVDLLQVANMHEEQAEALSVAQQATRESIIGTPSSSQTQSVR